jgi:predicted amidophosphoribosyltransferase
VAGAFAVRPRRAGSVQGKRVLLIDDVLTTGATLGACTRALKKAGARHVDVLVLARVVRETDVTI